MIKISKSSSFESLKVVKLLESNGIKVFVSYECLSSIQPWIISSGGNYITILKVNDVDHLKSEILLKKYYEEESLVREQDVVDLE